MLCLADGRPSAGAADPILYFYEHFLAAYDKVERIKKGVYYTPRPLVDYLVRAVDDTLRSTFGRPLGLADKDVRLLDPATGTGTFLLAAAQKAAEETAAALGSGAVKGVIEQPGGARHGVVAFVTNHGFINNRVHRGVRRALLDAFDDIYVLNLHGNQRLWVKGLVDEKVFRDVQQGVAMTVLVRRGVEHDGLATVRYREMRGTRKQKYEAVQSLGLADDGWAQVTPTEPYWSFAPADTDTAQYESWRSMPDIFPVSTSGIQSSHDDLVVAVSTTEVEDRMRQVDDEANSDEELKERFAITENDRWNWSKQRQSFSGFDSARVVPWLYRLFDRRYLYLDPVFVQWPRTKVMRHMLPSSLGLGGERRIALVVQRSRPVQTIATVVRGPASAHVTGHWCHVYPLRLSDAAGEETLLPAPDEWRENIDPGIVENLTGAFGRRPSVEEVGWYAFAVISAPSYSPSVLGIRFRSTTRESRSRRMSHCSTRSAVSGRSLVAPIISRLL